MNVRVVMHCCPSPTAPKGAHRTNMLALNSEAVWMYHKLSPPRPPTPALGLRVHDKSGLGLNSGITCNVVLHPSPSHLHIRQLAAGTYRIADLMYETQHIILANEAVPA